MSYVETSILKNATIMLLHAERDEVDLNPSYQRSGGVWTLTKRRLLIDSIINDYDIPKLYFHQLSHDEFKISGFRYAVIDGRQRLETIWNFLDGKFSLSPEFEYQRDDKIDMKGYTYKDIAQRYPKIRIKFDSFVLPIVTVVTAENDLDLIEDMFSRLNEAVPLNAAERRNAIGGDLVQTINNVSNSPFFTEKVKFSDSRYKHREVAARLLLLEESLRLSTPLVDTKREYMDALAKKYHHDNNEIVSILEQRVTSVLEKMYGKFADKDELLSAQGIQGVYYLVFRTAIKTGELNRVSRHNLDNFRKSLADNRNNAAENYEDASFELLEFDRLNQQGTNDANSIKERYSILCNYLGVSSDNSILGRPSQQTNG